MTIVSIGNSTLGKSNFELLNSEWADQRTAGWFLIGSPLPIFGILMFYLVFVLKLGPNYMKDKKPFSLKGPMMIYNFLQVVANLYLFNEGLQMWSSYNWNCQLVDYSNSPTALRQAWACYLYFLNKLSDLVDTVFFTLRKKDKQVTFLHVFHHTVVPITMWLVVKYVPGGQITFPGFLNSFVHVILYSYYFLTALGPNIQKYLWWKKYITKLQLVQFVLITVHYSQLFVFDCDYPKWTALMIIPNMLVFTYLFTDFYKMAYNTGLSKTCEERNNKKDC